MPPKKKSITPKLSTPVDSHKHVDKRANIPTEELRDFGRWALHFWRLSTRGMRRIPFALL